MYMYYINKNESESTHADMFLIRLTNRTNAE